MILIDAVKVLIICGSLASQMQLSECKVSPRFGIQRLPDPSLPTVPKEEPIIPVASPQDPPSRPNLAQQASPQDPPPRSSFPQQASPQDTPPRSSFPQQASPQDPPPRSSFPQQANGDIVRSNMEGPNEDGSYAFSYETSDGSKREEQGSFHGPSSSLVVRGSYSYIAPDGTLVEVKYIADERGFRAESPHIPAIPPHALEQIKAAEVPATPISPVSLFIKDKILPAAPPPPPITTPPPYQPLAFAPPRNIPN